MPEPPPAAESRLEEHNRYQREYFAQPERSSPRMAPVRTPYVERHLTELLARLGAPAGCRLLDVGAGMGRFSLPLAERGFRVTAVDLAPELLEVLRRHDPEGRVETLAAALEELPETGAGPWDAAVGFFFLHHLADLRAAAESLARVLPAGARVAFCEPNAYHLPFYLQIAATPGMTFAGDGGIARMRPGRLLPAFAAAGFRDVETHRYGFFPPAVANTRPGRAVEAALERLPPLAPVRAFQILTATRGGG